MLGSETLEVAIGLAVLFTFMSLFASALRETIEAWFKRRAALVHKGLAQLFSDAGSEADPTLRQFYETIVISPLFKGAYDGVKADLPSYIRAQDFASAVLDLARKEAGAKPAAALSDWAGALKDTRVSKIVRVAIEAGGGDPARTRAYLEQWFDGQMNRVSGWYKRETHWWLIAIGLVAAVLLNVDAIAVTKHFYRNDAMREVIVAHAQAKPPVTSASAPPVQPQQVAGELRDYGFPIGWSWQGGFPKPDPQCALRGEPGAACGLGSMSWLELLLMIAGWIVTALGISLGAPFWFDVLNKVMVIRSTVKPDEKSPPEASKDAQPAVPGGALGKSGSEA